MNPELELNAVAVDFLQANHFILKTRVGSKKLNKLYHIKRKIKKLHATVSPAMYIHTSSKLIWVTFFFLINGRACHKNVLVHRTTVANIYV